MPARTIVAQNQGAIAIGLALTWVVFLGFVALVIDLGLALVTRNQLQNITDGASLAGSRELGRIYEGLTPTAQRDYVLTGADQSAILAEVRELGEKNVAGGTAIDINPEDIVIGRWNRKNKQLTPTDVAPDAVWVLTRRDDQANGPLMTSFASIVGTDRLHVSAQSTAALTGISQVIAAELDAPIGISRAWFETNGTFCHQSIQFFPTNTPESCAGWHTFLDASSNLQDIIEGLRTGTFTSPAAKAGETQFYFTGADEPSIFEAFQALYAARAVCSTTGALCGAGPCDGLCAWSTFIGVYDVSDCSAPYTASTIVGFATATIDQVEDSPDNVISGRVECGVVQPKARGGGPYFGTKGSIPGLVQ